jgi:hypothetical protein
MEHWWNDTDRGKIKILEEKPVPVSLSAKNPTWTGLESNPGGHLNTAITRANTEFIKNSLTLKSLFKGCKRQGSHRSAYAN